MKGVDTSAIVKWRPLGTTIASSGSCSRSHPIASSASMAPGVSTRAALILGLLSFTRLNFSSALRQGQLSKAALMVVRDVCKGVQHTSRPDQTGVRLLMLV